jgi:signal peptidase I
MAIVSKGESEKLAEEEKPEKKENFAWEIIKTIIIVGLLVFFFRFFIIQPYYIIGSSMEPKFHNGNYLFIDEVTYRFFEPKRGDIIVFKHPDETCVSYVETSPVLRNFFQGPCQNYIKRIIGLPGETVKIENGKVIVMNTDHPQGITLNEPYIEKSIQTSGKQTFTVGSSEYFVLGDNRHPNASSDSREWGLLNKKYIVGRGWLRLLPPDEAGFIKKPQYN